MIKTKSLFMRAEESDGTRIIVSGGFPSNYPTSSFDEHYPELAPTKKLLYDYKYHELPWEEYEVQFFQLMKGSRARRRIEELSKRSKEGEVITLLCFEHSDEKCHRRLVKGLIEGERKQVQILANFAVGINLDEELLLEMIDAVIHDAFYENAQRLNSNLDDSIHSVEVNLL